MNKTLKNNSLRLRLLEFLREIYPEGAEERTIVEIFYEYHRYPVILQSLEYLTQKEYISRKQVPHPYKKLEKLSLYKLAHKGVDLLDGVIEDPAVRPVPPQEA